MSVIDQLMGILEENEKKVKIADEVVTTTKLAWMHDIPNPQDVTISFTGTLEHFTRQEAENKCSEIGFKCTKNINKQLCYLVVGDKTSSSAKIAKAENNAFTSIINEQQWGELISYYKNIKQRPNLTI